MMLTQACMMNRRRRMNGFTLMELMIALVVLAIIVGIAVPSYSSYMVDARRSDAIAFLMELAGEQQRHFSEYNEYAGSLKDLGYPNDSTTSPEGHYSVSVSDASSNLRYVLTATPVSDGKQAGDSECKAFVISSTGAKSNTGTNTDCW
ncbi:MAG: type IV pilin protein [Granulosicoccus sp.]